MRLTLVTAILFGLSAGATIAGEPSFRSLAARTAYRQYRQDLDKAEAAYRAAVQKAQEEYRDALTAARNGAMDRRDLDEANAIQKAIDAIKPDAARKMKPATAGSPCDVFRQEIVGTIWRWQEKEGSELQFLADGRTNGPSPAYNGGSTLGRGWAVIAPGIIVTGYIPRDGRPRLRLWRFSPDGTATEQSYVKGSETWRWRLVRP